MDHKANKGRGKFRKFLPYVFNEHGALMLASVLQSDVAINAGIFVVRAFIQLRNFLENNKELAKKVEDLETKFDKNFILVFEIRDAKSETRRKNQVRNLKFRYFAISLLRYLI